jgi:hypothetical protein
VADQENTQASGGSGTGDGTGGASPNAGQVTFTPEQQAHIDGLVSERLKRAQTKWQTDAQAAADKAKAEGEATTLAEQKKFAELAEQRAKERDAAVTERDAERAQVKQFHLREAFRGAAATLKLKWATDTASADAFALVATEVAALDVGESGAVKGMDTVLTSLQTSRPYLFAKPEQAGDLNAGDGRGAGKPQDDRAHQDEIKRRFRL